MFLPAWRGSVTVHWKYRNRQSMSGGDAWSQGPASSSPNRVSLLGQYQQVSV